MIKVTIHHSYGICIVFITLITRIVFVGFCWSYGTVIVELKRQNTTLSDTELSWIGSLGQSFGGLIAPCLVYFLRHYGYQWSFFVSFVFCVLSLLFSSLVSNLHWLLLTYALPYGFGNAAVYLLGTLICGLYYPIGNRWQHVLAMCIISSGFPLGYHLMSGFIHSTMENHGWQSMKRRIALLELVTTLVLTPFFTTKFLKALPTPHAEPTLTHVRSKPERISYCSIPILCWMMGIFTSMCAINNFLLHLHGYLESLQIPRAHADFWFRLHGLFDGLFRLLIPIFLHFYPTDITYLFPLSVLIGFICLVILYGLIYTMVYPVAILPIILFSLTSAVTTSLQYTVSNQLFDTDQTEEGYIYHVIVMSIGCILGPVVGGRLIDLTGNYSAIIPTSMVFLTISFIAFCVTIYQWRNQPVHSLPIPYPIDVL